MVRGRAGDLRRTPDLAEDIEGDYCLAEEEDINGDYCRAPRQRIGDCRWHDNVANHGKLLGGGFLSHGFGGKG